MEVRTYPTLPQGLGLNLKAIERLIEFDPGYLSDPNCPYPEEVKSYLRRLVAPAQAGREDSVGTVFKDGQTDEEEADSLIAEIQSAINSMRRLQSDMEGPNIEVQDKLNFLKNYGSLMDRFLSLKEKAQGSKSMYEFQRIVITILEQIMDKDQRYEFKQKLKEAGLASE
ncbi:hypothetical protein [Methylorubrum suomiense]|uniref:Uncharacterized protein n=1 Tax=Methylorubrum suomiense TaxID=144191 RepID=A0ABQ4V0G5_9HYPH|nr:hypothetical protein [Methylorubrum suomiense]GJE78075.1 hypothetical protein BGCPKDLD_4686 [Methylorubrum suomiense]